ncbi:MAG: hypothetical protein ACI4XM_00665 [Candidatus Coprovivens sp.]
MVKINEILKIAEDTLTEAKIIKAEEGPEKVKKYVEKVLKRAAKADKTELCQLSNYDIFVPFLILVNDNKLSFDETLSYCEEVKKSVNSWTYDKDGHRLSEMQNGINDDGSLKDYKYLSIITELGLTPIFTEYNMKLVYMCMYEYLKLKKELLNLPEYSKKLPLVKRIQLINNIYKNSRFYNFIDVAQKILKRDTDDHELRQYASSKRIEVTTEVIKGINDESILGIYEIPSDWHQFLDPRLLELLYEIVLDNLYKLKKDLDIEEQEITSKKNRSKLTTYLYNHNLNPYSLNEKLAELESIANITERIEFLISLGLPLNNVLTLYYNYIISLDDEKLKTLSFLLDNNILSKQTLSENLDIIDSNYQQLISNYEILKNIIDFQNIFYDDRILLKDIKEIKNILSVLKEYKLTKNNYIFLLCHYEYINIYDLLLENEISESLFISICETENPLNTIKRIIIFRNIGEEYETSSHFLKKSVTAESKFICDDSSLDDYLPNTISSYGINFLSGDKITTIVDSDIVKAMDEEYQIDNIYLIGDIIISRPKFLRNFEQVQGNKSYLIPSLVSQSILEESSFLTLTNELTKKTLKK